MDAVKTAGWSSTIIVGAAICVAGVVLLLTGWNWGSLIALIGFAVAMVGTQGYSRGRRGRRGFEDRPDGDGID